MPLRLVGRGGRGDKRGLDRHSSFPVLFAKCLVLFFSAWCLVLVAEEVDGEGKSEVVRTFIYLYPSEKSAKNHEVICICCSAIQRVAVEWWEWPSHIL